jgi:tetratricopeptide (TPR) repeat protein
VALSEVPCDELEIKIFALIIYGVIEKDFGRITDAVAILREAANIEVTGHLVTGRCNIDLATTLKDFALSEHDESYLVEAKFHFFQALYEAEALGHHLNVACVENNIGFLLLNVGSYAESEPHLLRARKIFQAFGDSVRGAQVNDTLARLYVEMKEYKRAQGIIDNAVEALELTDSEGILAEALTTKGVVACGLGNYGDAKLCFDAAYKVAERCGDYQGAGRALLALFEQMGEHLNTDEVLRMVEKLKRLVLAIHQPYLAARIEQSIARTLSAAEGRDTAPR